MNPLFQMSDLNLSQMKSHDGNDLLIKSDCSSIHRYLQKLTINLNTSPVNLGPDEKLVEVPISRTWSVQKCRMENRTCVDV
jgi:hypothetical protein